MATAIPPTVEQQTGGRHGVLEDGGVGNPAVLEQGRRLR